MCVREFGCVGVQECWWMVGTLQTLRESGSEEGKESVLSGSHSRPLTVMLSDTPIGMPNMPTTFSIIRPAVSNGNPSPSSADFVCKCSQYMTAPLSQRDKGERA
eukprot:561865-Rhodomonas_salina.4